MVLRTSRQQRRIHRYLYALTAVCFSGKFAYYYAINQRYGFKKREMRKTLEQWEVSDHESMKQVLDWLIDAGRKEEFSQLQNQLNIFSEDNRQPGIHSLPDDGELKKQAAFTNKYFRRVSPQNIAAFDYAFCIVLSRFGWKVGYLDSEEAYDYMLKAARLAQSSYSSWLEYITAYTIGVQFVDSAQLKNPQYIRVQEPAIIKLLSSRHSPFQKVKWDTKI